MADEEESSCRASERRKKVNFYFMELLEKYYEERIFCKGMPSFNELSQVQLNEIRATFGFALYNLSKKLQEIKKHFLKK